MSTVCMECKNWYIFGEKKKLLFIIYSQHNLIHLFRCDLKIMMIIIIIIIIIIIMMMMMMTIIIIRIMIIIK